MSHDKLLEPHHYRQTSKISHHLYTALSATPNLDSKWLKCIQDILNEAGRSDLWHMQEDISSKNISKIIRARLIDQNAQNWHWSLQDSSKGKITKQLKIVLLVNLIFSNYSLSIIYLW